jgi:site-specific DNA-methyltransferase (adenine-specific)
VKDGLSLHRKESDCKDFVVGLEDKPNHPSPKPERPIAWFIERLSSPGQMILDPFLGSGTTAYCAKKLQRRCIGIEIEEKYCEIAARRCQQEVMELNIIETVEQQNPLGLEI